MKKSKFYDCSEVAFELKIATGTLHNRISQGQNVPPYVIFPDKTLVEMAMNKPSNEEQMLAISGIGAVKFKRYGESFLTELKQHQ